MKNYSAYFCPFTFVVVRLQRPKFYVPAVFSTMHIPKLFHIPGEGNHIQSDFIECHVFCSTDHYHIYLRHGQFISFINYFYYFINIVHSFYQVLHKVVMNNSRKLTFSCFNHIIESRWRVR